MCSTRQQALCVPFPSHGLSEQQPFKAFLRGGNNDSPRGQNHGLTVNGYIPQCIKCV
jgi:hypothetical protein